MPEMPVECMWMGMRCEDCRKFLRDRIRLLECRPRGEFVKICWRDRQLNRDSSVGKHRETEKSKEHGTRFCGVPCSGKCCRTFCCVNYLQLKSELTGKIKTVASLETELSQIKEDNNAYESQVTSDVDLNTIKKLAIGRLGMNYPKDDQKKTYTMPSNSYVRQYQEVPESKR